MVVVQKNRVSSLIIKGKIYSNMVDGFIVLYDLFGTYYGI